MSEENSRINSGLNNYKNKVEKSAIIKESLLSERAIGAKIKNQSVDVKLQDFKWKKEEFENSIKREAEEKDKTNHIRLKRIYDHGCKMFNQQKQQKREMFAHLSSRQADGNQAIKQRNRQILFKLERSQKQVEDYIKARDHEMMLKQELRKLRESDMVKVK